MDMMGVRGKEDDGGADERGSCPERDRLQAPGRRVVADFQGN